MATLVPRTGLAVIEVANVDGVRIAGFILEAGTKNSPTLLKIGSEKYSGS